MNIILARHGNTFSPGETAVWVGAGQDLPLVDTGVQQAKDLARCIQCIGTDLKAVYCGPLKRTSDYANIVIDELCFSLQPIVDVRLNELDYGRWSGLHSSEIRQRDCQAELAAWENLGQWPQQAGWSGSAKQVAEEVHAFAADMLQRHPSTGFILVITSSGRLRYFLRLIPGAFERHVQCEELKVDTGNLCLLTHKHEQWRVVFWNKQPNLLRWNLLSD